MIADRERRCFWTGFQRALPVYRHLPDALHHLEVFQLVRGYDAVGHGVVGADFPVLLEGLVDCGTVSVRVAVYSGQGEPEGLLVESFGLGGVCGRVDRLCRSGLQGFIAVSVGVGRDAGLPVAEGAGAGGGARGLWSCIGYFGTRAL